MTAIRLTAALVALSLASVFAGPARALEPIAFSIAAPDAESRETLERVLPDISAMVAARAEDNAEPPTLIGAALSDYGTFLEALYSEGFYSGVISITLDGREAANIPLLQLPQQIDRVVVSVETGPAFRFSRAEIAPKPGSAELPEGFAVGERARAGVVGDAVSEVIDAWRERGRAKAAVVDDTATANHADATLAVDIAVEPGPSVTFGEMILTTESSVRASAIRRIAGFPSGRRYSPERVERVLERLRRTGAFSAVVLTEEDPLGPDAVMDMYLEVSDQKPRRIGFGAELSTQEGLGLTAFWLHRNFFGGAERLRFDASISDIGSNQSGIDYSLAGRLEIPAIYGADTDGFLRARLSREDEPTYLSNRFELGVGATRRLSDAFTLEVGTTFVYADTEDDLGEREFTLLTFPATLTYDVRSNELNPKQGYFVTASATPYLGLRDTQSGLRFYTDARMYLGFGDDDPNVFALRLQLGSVVGSEIDETSPDFLFYSGGGGTVRGQPFQSLTVDLGNGREIGGRSFLGVSTEFRRDLTDAFSAVAFYDAGYVGAESWYDGTGQWHAGAGVGIRYQTAIGPIRFDIATPTSGDTGEGLQYYIGIGQAF